MADIESRKVASVYVGEQPTVPQQSTPQVMLERYDGTNPVERIISYASPHLDESRSANFQKYDLTHAPADIHAYINTGSRTFSFSIPLISRNIQEARLNYRTLSFARKWVLPPFSTLSGAAPGSTTIPYILRLSAYKHPDINRVPVILQDYRWSFPNDVDYIFSDPNDPQFVPMPVVGELSLSLTETYSASQLTNGDWRMKQIPTNVIDADLKDAMNNGQPTKSFSITLNDGSVRRRMQTNERLGIGDAILDSIGNNAANVLNGVINGGAKNVVIETVKNGIFNSAQIRNPIAGILRASKDPLNRENGTKSGSGNTSGSTSGTSGSNERTVKEPLNE